MRPAVPLCDNCRRSIRESERCDLSAPARRGEPAMVVKLGACRFCQPDSDDEARDLNAYFEQRISEIREGL